MRIAVGFAEPAEGIASMPHENTNRRSFLGWLTTAVLTLIALLLAVPAIAYVWSPLRKRQDDKESESGFADIGAVADLPIGRWLLMTVEVVRRSGWEMTRANRGVWVRRTGEGSREVTVLSPICPHLGCSILWQADSAQFMCPCHKGTFDAEGKLTGGPPPRGMDSLDSEVRGGRLWVHWQDFKIGTPERRSVEA
jgi:menaquinol-cytochrome c reductase iron-sulfur subunit